MKKVLVISVVVILLPLLSSLIRLHCFAPPHSSSLWYPVFLLTSDCKQIKKRNHDKTIDTSVKQLEWRVLGVSYSGQHLVPIVMDFD